ncbi:flagellar assembly protein FliH [Paenibacillus alkalitolerans]|uniref:flagellar assembly protein FliH n=1 Tax=Paenibacillus alkalitolerans TaxID=2799335 RepID=UPI0018F285B2|nr:flagellar assembly protein FliH [Paenibacillus alkalitolerans]
MSNVIKPHAYVSMDEKQKIEAFVYCPPAAPAVVEADTQSAGRDHPIQAEMADKMLADAKLAAEELLKLAAEETAQMREHAAAEIDAWWNERRIEDLRVIEESRQSGFEAGYREGLQQAEREIRERYEALLHEAGQLIEHAHRVKEATISEAEPFLVELSLGIARKIIGRHVEGSPEWTVAHVKKTLERRREKGIVTLCVAPSQFGKMQDARAELSLAIDSQAELQIVPDNTVDEGGCVVRTSFGSIDARIDTQLAEVKKALLEVALSGEEGDRI